MRKRNNEGDKKEEHRTGAVLRLVEVFLLIFNQLVFDISLQ